MVIYLYVFAYIYRLYIHILFESIFVLKSESQVIS